MSLALLAGIVWDGGAYLLKDLTLPALAAVMTLSTTGITGDAFRSIRSMVIPAVSGIFASYLLHGGLLLAISTLLVKDNSLWTGFVVLAAVPPAVAVIPFAFFLRADTNFALFGTIGGYLGALFLTPLIILAFLGSGFINLLKVFIILMELIIVPLIVSRILLKTGLTRWIEPAKGTIINWCFFLVIYIMVGLNRNVFLGEPLTLMFITCIALLSTFVFGWLIETTGKALKLDSKVLTSIVLIGTFKNYGLAGGISLAFFSPETAIPATITSIVGILYIIYLEWKTERLSRPSIPS